MSVEYIDYEKNLLTTAENFFEQLENSGKYREVEYERIFKRVIVHVFPEGFFSYEEVKYEPLSRVKEEVIQPHLLPEGSYKGIKIIFDVVEKGKQKKSQEEFIVVFKNHKLEE